MQLAKTWTIEDSAINEGAAMNEAAAQQVAEIQGMLNAHKQHWITLEQQEIDILISKLIELQSVIFN